MRDIDPPKWHDLDRLAGRLPEPEARELDEIDLPELTRWAIEGRYPSDLAEATEADATRAVGLARLVLETVRRLSSGQ